MWRSSLSCDPSLATHVLMPIFLTKLPHSNPHQLHRFLKDSPQMIEIRFALRAIYPELLNIHRQYSAGGAISDAFNIQVLAGPLLRLFLLCV